MALSQSLRNRAVVIEKYITIPVASATVVGPAVPAGTLVLAAGVEVLAAVSADPTTYTVAASDGTTTFMAATSIKSLAAGAIKAGTTAGLVSAADTVDAVVVVFQLYYYFLLIRHFLRHHHLLNPLHPLLLAIL